MNAWPHWTEYRCTRCDELLNEARIVWLELNSRTGIYSSGPVEPPEDSQGGFPFGAACARRVLGKRQAR